MRALALLMLLTACQGSGDDDYRIIPGGDDTIIVPLPDASPEPDAPGDGGAMIEGRVCVLRDARDLSSCEPSGVSGLEVTLGDQSATTGADGTFLIATPTGTDLVWHVTGTNLVTSVMPFTPTPTIPAISVTGYGTLMLDNGVVLDTEQGSIFARVVSADAPLAGATVSSDPSPAFGPFYDGTDEAAWDQDATGDFGVAWLPGVTGAATVTVTPPEGATVEATAPVEAGAITFVTVAVP
jgi:hypothetical protein